MEVAPKSCRTSPELHAVWQHCGRKWAGMRYARSKTSLLMQTYFFLLATRVLNASPVGEGLRKTAQELSPLTSAMPRVKASASPRLHVEAIYAHTQRTDLKWQKKVIYPLVRDARACKKDVSNGYQCERFAPFEARWHTMQN